MGNPGEVIPLPSGSSFPPYYTQLQSITDASGEPVAVIMPDSGTVTISGVTDAGPGTNSTVLAFLFSYGVDAGLPDETTVVASSNAVVPVDLGVKDSKGNELYHWSVTLDTAGLAPGVYALQSFVNTEGFVTTNGVPEEIYADEPDQATVTVSEFVPFTYVVHEDTKIVSVGAAQTDTSVYLPSATSNVQISTDGRYAVWTNGDQYEEDLQTGATVDLTATDASAPALATDHSPTLTPVDRPDPYGPQPSSAYTAITYPTFVEGGVTFGSIPDFDLNPNTGSQNPLPTATDASGNTAVLTPFGSSPVLVGYATAASDNANAVLTVESTNVSYFTPFSNSGITASPQYYVTYRSPAPTLSIDPVNGTDQFAPGATSVTLTGASDAIGQSVEIDFGQAGAEVGTATVQANGTWSYTFNASAITGSSLFIEASVMSALGTPAEVSETAEINTATPPKVTNIFGSTEEDSKAFGPGETLTIYVTLSAFVLVNGTPTLTLSNGEVATYSSGPESHDQLQFTYVPRITDPGSSDLSVTGLDLNGGSITDPNGNMPVGSYTKSLGLSLQTVPSIVSLSPAAGSDPLVTTSTTPGIVVRAEQGETVTVFDNGNAIGSGVTSFGGGSTLLEEANVTPTVALPVGQSVLTAVATDGSGQISTVSAPVTITVQGPDAFVANQAATSGALSGDYLWSNAANWSNGVPMDGATVTMAGIGADDIADLDLGSLTLSPATAGQDGQLFIENGLAVGSLTLAPSTEIDIVGNGQTSVLIVTGSITTTPGEGAVPSLVADGAGALLGDVESDAPQLGYFAENGGTVELIAAPNDASTLTYDNDGTFVLAAPNATTAASLAGVGDGDVLELPGTSVSAVTFGGTSVSVTTDSGTFDFTNVSYDGIVDNYTALPDDETGLEAITFTGDADVFSATTTAGSPDGFAAWSNAINWSANVPASGDSVVMAAVGVDDIAGLNLDNLSLSPSSANADGKLIVQTDLTVVDLMVAAHSEIDLTGATLTVRNASTVEGEIIVDPSTLSFEGAVSGSGIIDIGADSTVTFDGPVAASETIDFVSNTGTLIVGDPEDFDATIAGSGTEIVICYLRGTRVLTPMGEVPIETLVPGDHLITRFGGVQAIKWIGRQSFAARFLAHNPAQWPVCITAGALGGGRPVRDLLVSPGHSMLLDGSLILARNLVNGISITHNRPASDVHYYQVEFEAQDCILAEGSWSESYADAEGLRDKFHNASEFSKHFPDYRSPSEPQLCARRPESGRALEAALRPIAAHAAAGLTPGPLRGWIDSIEPGRITGWAQDETYPDLPVLLDIRLHDRLLGTVLACDFRADIEEAGMGRGYSSFAIEMDIPAASLRHVTVNRSADGTALPAVPTALQRQALRGHLDCWRGGVLHGWAQNPDEPEIPVSLDILVDGLPVRRVLADLFRADVHDAGLGSGYHGFEADLPASAQGQAVEVRRVTDGAVLGMMHGVSKTRARHYHKAA